MKDEIRKKLESMSENNYALFSGKIIPGARNILGIRMPILRAYAKELVKQYGEEVLDDSDDHYYAEVLLRGMIIGYAKPEPEKLLKYIRDYVPLIDNWAVCDTFCSTLKIGKKNLEGVFEFLRPYIHSHKEFEQRFAAVMLLDHFINEEYIDRTLEQLRVINTEKYYSSMGVAWALAEAYIKYPHKAEPYISGKVFEARTHDRAIGKLCDSYRIAKEDKERLKALKINIR